jgi:hypothetical protein
MGLLTLIDLRDTDFWFPKIMLSALPSIRMFVFDLLTFNNCFSSFVVSSCIAVEVSLHPRQMIRIDITITCFSLGLLFVIKFHDFYVSIVVFYINVNIYLVMAYFFKTHTFINNLGCCYLNQREIYSFIFSFLAF